MTLATRLEAIYRAMPSWLRAAVPPRFRARLKRRIAPAKVRPVKLARGTKPSGYSTGAYWARRSDLIYYQYFRFIIRCIGKDASSMADVGSGNCPYLDWFDWIPERVSIDIREPYRSATVRGIQGDIHALDFPERFDLVTCLQVLEHVDDPAPFARRLLQMGRLVLISVPHRWPKGVTPGHVNDPVDLRTVERWFGRRANYHIVAREPFLGTKGERLFVLFDPDAPRRRFGGELHAKRRRLPRPGAA